jgi:ABC-type sulfate transport system permease subunit
MVCINNKIVNKFVNLPFVISGIIILVSGILLFNHTNNFINSSQKTEAIISNVSCVKDDCTAQ